MNTYPIVLAHGIARFDILAHRIDLADGLAGRDDSKHYFRGIRSELGEQGFAGHHAAVPYAESVANRAAALRLEVERVLRSSGAPKVHVVAHSMGGLDARHMLFDGRDDRVHEKVASLVTIGTPHLGTSFADWGIRRTKQLYEILECLGIASLDGFRDLTTHACREFDAKARAFEDECGVHFATVAGTQELRLIFAPLQVPWFLIHESEGPNDGLVSFESARWRPELLRAHVDADHLNLTGWWEPNDALGLFPSLAAKLRSRAAMESRIRELYVEIARDLAVRFPWTPPAR
jgi:triacylglycerol lipase